MNINVGDLYFYLNLSALICGIVTLIFGIIRTFKNKLGTYFNIALMALGTLTLGFLFYFINVLSSRRIFDFSLGFLAVFGSFLFFFTSNRSYISVLEDAPTKHRKRATIISCIMPALFAAELVMVTLKVGLSLALIPSIGLFFSAGFCSFFSFREVLLPDVRRGFIDCMRPYNLMVCILSLCCLSMDLMTVYNAPAIAFLILGIISDITLLLLMLFLYKGVCKWRT